MATQSYKSNAIFDHKLIADFIDMYAKSDNWHNLDKRTGNFGYGWIHYGLIRNLKPQRILCIGSRYGYVPAICALACKDNSRGIVDFVDAGYDQDHDVNHWHGKGTWKQIEAKDYFAPFQLSERIKLHVETTAQFIQKNVKRNWDYIYIDGDHSYDGSKFDYLTFWPHLNPKGYMAFHDITCLEGNAYFGVHDLWNKLKTIHQNTIEIPGLCGLGLIQKPSQSINRFASFITAMKQRYI